MSQQFSTPGAARRWLSAIAVMCGLTVGSVFAGESPVRLEVSLERSTLTVGEPLVLDMRVTNISGGTLSRAVVGSGGFRKTWYTGSIEEGCELAISVPDGSDSAELDFAFDWLIEDLETGETASCRVTFPSTLFSGTETVDYRVFALSAPWEMGEFTYTLLPVHSDVPIEVDASVEQSPQRVGDPLVINLQAKNTSGDGLAPFVIESHQPFQLPGREGFVAEGCEVDLVSGGEASNLVLRWYVPETQAGETASCRLRFTDTPSAGTESLSFSAWILGTRYEQLATVNYTLLANVHAVPLGGPLWLVLAGLLLLLAAHWRLRQANTLNSWGTGRQERTHGRR